MSSKDWKKKNYTKEIKVSSAVVAELRKGTKASNIAKANAPGASAEFREAVRRFYGKSTTKTMPMAGGKTVRSGPRRVSKPATTTTKSPSKPTGRQMTGAEKAAAIAGTAAAAALAVEGLTKGTGKHAKTNAGGRHKSNSVSNKVKSISKGTAKSDARHARPANPNRPGPRHSAGKTGGINKMKAQGPRVMSQGIRYTKLKYEG